jgi:hypothetical protein
LDAVASVVSNLPIYPPFTTKEPKLLVGSPTGIFPFYPARLDAPCRGHEKKNYRYNYNPKLLMFGYIFFVVCPSLRYIVRILLFHSKVVLSLRERESFF